MMTGPFIYTLLLMKRRELRYLTYLLLVVTQSKTLMLKMSHCGVVNESQPALCQILYSAAGRLLRAVVDGINLQRSDFHFSVVWPDGERR